MIINLLVLIDSAGATAVPDFTQSIVGGIFLLAGLAP
jgi:hypothetical protein